MDRTKGTGYRAVDAGEPMGRWGDGAMERLLLTYHPDAAFTAGRVADRLSLRLGDDVVFALHPDDHPDPDVLARVMGTHTALLVIATGSSTEPQAATDASVHLATSLAIRRDLPIMLAELASAPADESEPGNGVPDGSGLVRMAVDPDRLDSEIDRLVAGLENWLSGARVIPRIELSQTMLPAFVGITGRLPTDESPRSPRLITTWTQFENLYGGFVKDALLPISVYGWFLNGGRECYIAPIQPEGRHDEAPSTIGPRDYAGSEDGGFGINGLGRLEDVTALVLPDVASVAHRDGEPTDLGSWKSIQLAAINHCESYRRIALLDSPPGMSPQQVHEWRVDEAMYDSPSACLHYPWATAWDPTSDSAQPRAVPPSGHIAGAWARSDRERGVWRSPANQVVAGVLDADVRLTANERYLLSTDGINPIRVFLDSDEGIRVWGSRTLSSNPWFFSLEVARSVSAIQRACARGLRWATFEPDSAATRSTAKRQLEEFLTGLWKSGALVGQRQAEAFYVHCSDDESVHEGLQVTVGIATVTPGAFIDLVFARRYGEQGAVFG